MTMAVFDLTEFTQLTVRMDTGVHPDGRSLGIYMQSGNLHVDEVDRLREEGRPIPPEFSGYDAVDWDRAVEMARWILEQDRTPEEEE